MRQPVYKRPESNPLDKSGYGNNIIYLLPHSKILPAKMG
jgi:hypothetical protein